MPKLTEIEWKVLTRLNGTIFDIMHIDLNLSEKRADMIAQKVQSLIVKLVEEGE